MRPVITLTTDFGARDAYVGSMKGVMLQIASEARFVDITHAIPPQNVRHTAYVLWSVLPHFPESAVHLVVVDPGVGTERRAIAAKTPWGTLVGPDNGIFTCVWLASPPESVVALTNPQYHRQQVSRTFHGRDVFAPAAAHLAAGVPLTELGPGITDPVRLPEPEFAVGPGELRGEVIAIDHFGNAVTSVGRLYWDQDSLRLVAAFGESASQRLDPAGAEVRTAGRSIGPIRATYGEVSSGDVLALVGSEGMLEIAVNQGNAAESLGLTIGDPVSVRVTS